MRRASWRGNIVLRTLLQSRREEQRAEEGCGRTAQDEAKRGVVRRVATRCNAMRCDKRRGIGTTSEPGQSVRQWVFSGRAEQELGAQVGWIWILGREGGGSGSQGSKLQDVYNTGSGLGTEQDFNSSSVARDCSFGLVYRRRR